jgi:hypothetical protein
MQPSDLQAPDWHCWKLVQSSSDWQGAPSQIAPSAHDWPLGQAPASPQATGGVTGSAQTPWRHLLVHSQSDLQAAPFGCGQ